MFWCQALMVLMSYLRPHSCFGCQTDSTDVLMPLCFGCQACFEGTLFLEPEGWDATGQTRHTNTITELRSSHTILGTPKLMQTGAAEEGLASRKARPFGTPTRAARTLISRSSPLREIGKTRSNEVSVWMASRAFVSAHGELF